MNCTQTITNYKQTLATKKLKNATKMLLQKTMKPKAIIHQTSQKKPPLFLSARIFAIILFCSSSNGVVRNRIKVGSGEILNRLEGGKVDSGDDSGDDPGVRDRFWLEKSWAGDGVKIVGDGVKRVGERVGRVGGWSSRSNRSKEFSSSAIFLELPTFADPDTIWILGRRGSMISIEGKTLSGFLILFFTSIDSSEVKSILSKSPSSVLLRVDLIGSKFDSLSPSK